MATGDSITWWAVASAFGGAVIGAVVSGTINFVLQRNSFAQAKAQRDTDRLETRKARAYSLLFKVIKITSNLNNLRRVVRGQLAQAKKDGLTGDPFQFVVPMGALPDAIHFTAEEMAFVLSIDGKLFNEMAVLDDIHNSTVAIFVLYENKRSAVMDRFGAEMKGNVGTVAVSQAEMGWFRPRAVELNSLVNAMLQRSEQDGREAFGVLTRLHALLEKEFDLKHKLERKPEPEGATTPPPATGVEKPGAQP